MNEILQKLDEAYKLISSLSVSGDVVDVIAAVRFNLREAQAKIEGMKSMCAVEMKKEDADGQTG